MHFSRLYARMIAAELRSVVFQKSGLPVFLLLPSMPHLQLVVHTVLLCHALTVPNPWIGQRSGHQGATFEELDEVCGIASGANASFVWTGLSQYTAYEWYAVVSDGSEDTTGPTWSFTTGTASASLLGDVDGNGLVNSTDALIILSADAGISTVAFCPMNYGDVNADGLVNSTDALIILSYDAGLSVGSFPVGQPAAEPPLSEQPSGCGGG
jgi:hypothetical protein